MAYKKPETIPPANPDYRRSTIDPPMGQAPVPPESEHVIHPAPVVAPNFVMERSQAEHMVALYEETEAMVGHVAQGAMDQWLQNAVIHLRHTLVGCKDLYLSAKQELSDLAAEAQEGSGSSSSPVLAIVFLFLMAIMSAFLAPPTAHAQQSSNFPAQNNAASSSVGPGGAITNPSGNDIAISPGPVYCNGAISSIHNTKFTLTGPPAVAAVTSLSGTSQLFFVYYSCSLDQVIVSTFPPPSGTSVSLGTVLQSNAAGSLSYTITDLRSVSLFPNTADETFWVPETSCSGATTGTAGSGNATDILAGSGGARVFRISATNASSSANTLTCVFTVPTKLTTGKGFEITDITVLVSTQTTQPTSITLPTVKSFTVPAATDPETANSATFTAYCGTITQSPSSAQFAAYAAVTAGQFYSIKATCGTPVFMNTDLQVVQYVIVFNQSASAASLQEVAGLVVHGFRILP